MPRKPVFTSLFGRSPIAPIRAHIDIAIESAEVLLEYFDALPAGDWDRISELHERIALLESKADGVKRDIRLGLAHTVLLPFSRSDLLELVTVQDWIPNKIKDITGILLGRHLSFPEEVQEEVRRYVTTSVSAVRQTGVILEAFEDLMRSAFAERETDRLKVLISELGGIENESDSEQVSLREALFRLEADLNPIDVMFLYRVVQWIGEVSDHSETVGNRMLYLIARA